MIATTGEFHQLTCSFPESTEQPTRSVLARLSTWRLQRLYVGLQWQWHNLQLVLLVQCAAEAVKISNLIRKFTLVLFSLVAVQSLVLNADTQWGLVLAVVLFKATSVVYLSKTELKNCTIKYANKSTGKPHRKLTEYKNHKTSGLS